MAKALTKRSVQQQKELRISNSFVPSFWETVDGRLASVKRIKRRLEALRKDAKVDSNQKQMIAQRAVFLALQLETMEQQAATGGAIDFGRYSQGCNALLGLLRHLGLNSVSSAKRLSLKEYAAAAGGED